MANIAKTYTFVNGQPADATQVNKNFDDIIAGVGDLPATYVSKAGGTMIGNLIAPKFASITATIAGVPDTTPTTIYTFPDAAPAYWIVSADIGYQIDAVHFGNMAVVHTDGASSRLVQILITSGETLSMSGLNLQIAQTAGAPQNVSLTLTRVA